MAHRMIQAWLAPIRHEGAPLPPEYLAKETSRMATPKVFAILSFCEAMIHG
jgi:hypothetical protein